MVQATAPLHHGVMDALLEMAEPWAYLLVGLLALLESAAFVGLVAPGEATLIVGGVLVSRGHADLSLMVGVASAGAAIGDSIGYEVGRRLAPKLRGSGLLRRVGPERWARAENYLKVRGAPAIFFGRFIGLLRPLVPAAAGAVRMPYRKFLVANVVGGIVWATGSVLIGVAAGESWRSVEGWLRYASLGLAVAIGIALVGAVAVWWARRHRGFIRRLRATNSHWVWLLPLPFLRTMGTRSD
jgi:membrane-associated protein